VVKDAQTINLALGYEMNTIEFAIKERSALRNRLPEPRARFCERDRITEFYFEQGSGENVAIGDRSRRCTEISSTPGRAGKRCWASAPPRDSQGRPAQP